MKRLLLTISGILLLFSGGGVALAEPEAELPGELSMDDANEDHSTGVFSLAGSYADFTSRQVSGVVKVDLAVNGKPFQAEYDDASGRVSWDGHDASLFYNDRETLRALSNELLTHFRGLELSNHDFLLERLVLYLSDAPLGLPLPKQTIYIVEPQYERPDDLTSAAASFDPSDILVTEGTSDRLQPPVVMENCQAELVTTGMNTAAAAAACQQADDDGVYYMSCSRANRSLYHDAASHCFALETVNSGPGSTDCLGRCGAGCGGITGAVYTYDCGEHDRCCRVHGGCTNPFDASCGDEYSEAAGDFFAGTNCGV